MTRLAELQLRFAAADFLSFSEIAPGFIVIDVTTPFSAARIALQGAHVMTWQPKGQKPVIWLSQAAKFAPGKSIRGGVPICWPWFGPHATESGYPGHGFARTIPWLLLEAHRLPDRRVRLVFEPQLDETCRAQWPHASTVRFTVTLGQELVVSLATTNTGSTSFTLGQALHTYFAVGDVHRIEIAGLEGCRYIDKVDGGKRKKQQGRVTIVGEVDRIYLDTAGCCGIIDPAWKRTILITSTGSRSTVVWNPGKEKAARMGDFGRQGEDRMVCVETANAADDVITLAPGETHRMTAQYRVIAHG
ncbi:MAG: D-hexose-6-phosphate mutarotase [Pseudomonadota bacterium]|uniref:D-hexose-6-phosphate mutarotase n=1 Tax=Sulfuricystis thermophila TaxID=2496847 RepID=UPI0010365306|nr:D-hexose-6-phosphate mutarotase [Sulfuricystis thermophila]